MSNTKAIRETVPGKKQKAYTPKKGAKPLPPRANSRQGRLKK